MKINELKNQIADNFDEILNIRRHIHKNPELSFQEFNTANFIRKYLNDNCIDYQVMAETGTVALIGSGDVCVALRADIDALPIYEETGLEFASINDGVMHACGHDMHTTMLLATAKLLKSRESELSGTVKLIFQPGEEKLPGGAYLMIKEGVLENPVPDVIFGQHIYPSENSGTISVASGPVLASADELYWTIRGKGSHAAQPHLGKDAILAAANLINYYQSILTKFKNPLEAGVLSVTSIHGGSATNIFPEEVKMMGTLRAYNEVWRKEVHNILFENSSKIADLYGCECEIEIIKGYPPIINDEDASKFVREIASEIVGKVNTLDFEPKMWAEDFAYYAQVVPACFWMLGVKPDNLKDMPPLHNPKLNPDESAMINGIAMMVATTIQYINFNSNKV
ncbi:MAG: amidohydrolase [Candidatus Kapabacteria bacterium]|nr:amidohydrolase [Ignavibacteriota bacterium]MCW5885185.1 amidohydrolase [Candidatus Kapabacteria bacterium]